MLSKLHCCNNSIYLLKYQTPAPLITVCVESTALDDSVSMPMLTSSLVSTLNIAWFTYAKCLKLLCCWICGGIRCGCVLVFWGATAKLRKATISFIISVGLSVRPSVRIEQPGSHWKGFSWNLIFEHFSKICPGNSNCYVLLTVHLGIILDNDQLDTQLLCFTIRLLYSTTCFEHYMLIIRRLNCIDAASGIVTLKTSEWSRIPRIYFCCISYKH